MRSGNPFGTCVYCGKQIMWVRTKAGKNMPVNPQMISYRMPEIGKKGTDKIVTQDGEVVSADRTASNLAEGIGYISHFATCRRTKK